jgi:hypothetical protein
MGVVVMCASSCGERCAEHKMCTCIQSLDRAGPILRGAYCGGRGTELRSDTNNTSGEYVSFAFDLSHIVIAIAVRQPWTSTNQQ